MTGLQEAARNDVEIVRERNGARAIEDAWRALAVERGNVFITPEWFWTWMRHYGSGYRPLLGIVRNAEGGLRGLLPLVAAGRGRKATARFAGSALGDCFHPVARQPEELAVAAAVGQAFRADPDSPRSLVLENVPACEGWWRALMQAGGWPGTPLTDRPATLPRAVLAGRTWDDYMATRSRNLRSQLGRRRRALQREHDLRVRWSDADDDVRRDIALLFQLHDSRWRERQGESSLSSRTARQFHADLAAALQRQGWLRLAFLELDDKPVAAWYGWRVGESFAYYQAGFDPRWADHSVGLVLFAETIRSAVEEGAGTYDMLLGEEPFKLRFADSRSRVCTVLIAPRLSSARLLGAAEARLRAGARRLPESLRAPAQRRSRGLLARLPMARRR
jgi:CelD/BcsL family acetyltransferase involved in cellulose biosynthesis